MPRRAATFLPRRGGDSSSQSGGRMATVQDILATKGSQVQAIGPDATVYEAAVRMNEVRIGSLAVLHEGRLRGIITERDILMRIVAERRDPAQTRVGEIMTGEV